MISRATIRGSRGGARCRERASRQAGRHDPDHRPEPKKPQELIGHDCIGLRLPTHGGLYAWEFEKGGRELKVRVEGLLVFNTTSQMLHAALAGLGLAYVPEGWRSPT